MESDENARLSRQGLSGTVQLSVQCMHCTDNWLLKAVRSLCVNSRAFGRKESKENNGFVVM